MRCHRMIQEAAEAVGVDYAVASFAYPTVGRWDIAGLRRYDQIFAYWILPDFDAYRYVVDLYNAALRRFAEDTGSRYIEVAAHLRGGSEMFTDNCHLYANGIEQKADIIFGQLIPVLEEAGFQPSGASSTTAGP